MVKQLNCFKELDYGFHMIIFPTIITEHSKSQKALCEHGDLNTDVRFLEVGDVIPEILLFWHFTPWEDNKLKQLKRNLLACFSKALMVILWFRESLKQKGEKKYY